MNFKIVVGLAALACLSSIGCGIGNAPAPMSDEEAQARFKQLSPQDQISDINKAAMTPEQKAAAIAKIEAATGYKPASGAATAVSGQPHYGPPGS